MGWPLSQEYNEAVQNPRTAFGDADLRTGEVIPGPLGIPMPRSGNFADVYQLRASDGRMWAMKCFTRPTAGLRERYLKIDAHLRAARLPFSVGFQFLPEGIRVRGLWFPVLKMEWVEGQQLNEFVRENLDKPEHLGALLGMWVRLCTRLRESRLAHADLQHGNVLLVPGESAKRLKLRLIDYDGMWVPALAKSPSGEAGHPAYQHPLRLHSGEYSAHVDRFPHLVIGCALRALAVAGKPLWDRFDNGDNMLFREVDLANPTMSPLYRALWELDDPTVTNLVARLIVSTGRAIADTPWLDEVLEGDRTVPVDPAELNYAADVLGVPRRVVRRVAPAQPIYVVPVEANEFAEFDDEGPGFVRRRRKRSMSLTHAIVGFGGVAMVAAVILVAILAVRRDKHDDPGGKDPATLNDNGTPGVVAKTGLVETHWEAIQTGPAFIPQTGLVPGIDTAPPGSKIVRTLSVGTAASHGAWFLPDGRHALLAGRQGLAKCDLYTGLIEEIPQAMAEPLRVAVSLDGQRVVTATVFKTQHQIRCYDTSTGENLWSQPFDGPVGAIVFTPDNRRVAASSDRIGYREWSLKDGKEVRSHALLQASAFCFSPDGKQAIAIFDGVPELWNLDDGSTQPLQPRILSTHVCISGDGTRAYAASASGEIAAWVLPGGESASPRQARVTGEISALAAGPGRMLLVGTKKGEVSYIGQDDTQTSFTIGKSTSGSVVSFSISSGGQYSLVATEKTTLAITRLADLVRPDGPSRDGPSVGCLEFVRALEASPQATHFATDGKGDEFLVVTVDSRIMAGAKGDEPATKTGSRVDVYDATKFQRTAGIPRFEARIDVAGFGAKGELVTSELTAEGQRTRVRRLGDSDLVPGPAFKLDENFLEDVTRIDAVPHPNHSWVLVSTPATGNVLFDTATAERVANWPAPVFGDPARAVSSLDGQRIAIATNREPIRIWESETKQVALRIEGSEGVGAVAFLPNTTWLAGLWPQGRMRIWDVTTGELVREVDHDFPGPLSDLQAVTSDVVSFVCATKKYLMNLDTGKALNTGGGVDPLRGSRGFSLPGQGWVFSVDPEERLIAWRINSKKAATLPARPAPASAFQDVELVRDAPLTPSAGLTFASNGKSVLVATQSGLITRYSSDRLLQLGQIDSKPTDKKKKDRDYRLKSLIQGGDTLVLLSDPFKLATRNAVTLDRAESVPAFAPSGSTQPVLAVHPSGRYVMLSTNIIRLWELQENARTQMDEFKSTSVAEIPKAATGKPLTQFTWSADGSAGLARWGNKITVLWHPKKIGMVRVLEERQASVDVAAEAIALSPDGLYGVIGDADGAISVWETKTGKSLTNMEEYLPNRDGSSITAIAPLPNGRHFLSAGRSGRVILWEYATLKKLKTYRCPEGPWRIAVAPDGRTAVLHQPGYILRVDLPAEGKP